MGLLRWRRLLTDWRLHLAFTWWTLTIGFFLYKSYHPSIFGRYSSIWFPFACLNLAGSAAATAIALRLGANGEPVAGGSQGHLAWRELPLMSLAAASWGASLLTEYGVDREYVGRMLYGELLGATQPSGVLLEYVAFVLVAFTILKWCARSIQQLQGHHRTLSRALRIFIGLTLALLLAEGAVRAINIWNPRTQEAPTKPSRIWQTRYVQRNSLGYRDREFRPRAQAAGYRILLLGDSFTLGWGIPDPADRFGNRLEVALNSLRGPLARVTVLNAGEPAANSADELVTARALVPRLRPNLVLLIYVFNDIEHLGEPPRHPALQPSSFARRFSLHRLLMLNSHLADQALLLWRAWTWSGPSADEYFFAMYNDAGLMKKHLDVLHEIELASQSSGALFRIVPFELFPDDRHRERYDEFGRACEARGLPVWSMRSVFDGHPFETLIVNHRDRHPNERANRLVGDYLTTRVADLMVRERMRIRG